MTNQSASTLRQDPLTLDLKAGASLVRIHRIDNDAVWFGPKPGLPPAYRFDAPSGEYRTLYCAENLEGAFAETILRGGRRIVSRRYVHERQWSVLAAPRDLKLLKLFDNGLVWNGQTVDICAGDNYGRPQAFARDVYNAYLDVDGVAYRARHNNGEICYALFDRHDTDPKHSLEARRFADEPARTDELLRLHGASWDPMTPLPPSPR